jgi:putative RNA 2'-phosphotransferase
MNEKDKKHISKFLSLVLRHKPEEIGIVLDENGWAIISELIEKFSAKKIIFTKQQLEEIVTTNDKQRFVISEDGLSIRANQGHSIDVDLALNKLEPPQLLFHGTAIKFKEAILKEGIQKMNRQHVHLSDNIETAHKVGSRHGSPIILRVAALQMHNDGIHFYQSENGVWLTDFVSPNYISI